jgi:hypothetical protein
MKNLLIVVTTLLMAYGAKAQTYQHSLGLRFAGGTGARYVGLSSNYRLAKGLSLEGIAQTNFQDNHTVHLLLKRHRGLISRRFNYYYGGGLSLGSEESFIRDPETRTRITTYGNSTFGVDMIGGIEMTLLKLNVSFDIKPNINLTGRQNWITFQSGMTIRSVLVTRSQANRNKRQRTRERRLRERERNRSGLGQKAWWPF